MFSAKIWPITAICREGQRKKISRYMTAYDSLVIFNKIK